MKMSVQVHITPNIFDHWHTLRSPSNDRIEALTASSVNSGNSFRQFKKVVTSTANCSIWSGKFSGSKLSSGEGLGIWAGPFLRLRLLCLVKFGLIMDVSRPWRCTLRGNKFAAFSRNKKSICASRSRRWKADESIPIELPSWRAALAKFRSYYDVRFDNT